MGSTGIVENRQPFSADIAFSANQSRFTMRHLRSKLCMGHRASRKIVIRSSPNFGTSASCHSLSKPPTPDDLHQGDQSQHGSQTRGTSATSTTTDTQKGTGGRSTTQKDTLQKWTRPQQRSPKRIHPDWLT
ncbi:hypothetical protein PIB30_100902 [Stylosanthes scabra]|uniref:Uncharacterized protein n=1 Tax=Stylosanthes scabra TaxID=79078 RepID=A0ABU6QXZ7_9FABA|nr:hypothetical protein [Stylosanthes scabra]